MNDLFARILDSLSCPQCGSSGCGPYRCRFSAEKHSDFRMQRAQQRRRSSEELALDERAREAGL